MKNLITVILCLTGLTTGALWAGNAAPPAPVSAPTLSLWGILGLGVLVPMVAALVYKKKK